MENTNVDNYEIFDDSSSTVISISEEINDSIDIINSTVKKLTSEEVLSGNISNVAKSSWQEINESIKTLRSNLIMFSPFLSNTSANYMQTDSKVSSSF